MKPKSNWKVLIVWLISFAVIIAVASTLVTDNNTNEIKDFSEVKAMFEKGEVKEFDIVGSSEPFTLKILKTDNSKYEYKLKDYGLFYEELSETIQKQSEAGTLIRYNYEPAQEVPWWMLYLPYIIVIILFIVAWWLFITRASKNVGAGGGGGGLSGRLNSFSKARTKLGSDEKTKVMFNDVAGADEEKEELMEVVDFLKDPSKFSELGARIPKGVLLIGAPGTGKTLLAKAVAGESGVPFYSISGSDFVEMYVGVGASRVRDLFETAKKTAPCIIFIDEIDAVGRHRGAGWGGGHDEREQTLNQLLVEMDGFGVNDGVIVMAATNRPDILDPALMRPGRFDREITVNYPDIKGREAILKVHARNKPFGPDVDMETIARSTVGFTGADLANLLNEAALLAARKKKKVINMDDIEESTIKVLVGPQKKSMVRTEDDKRKTAYHEAGHAIVGKMIPGQDPVHQISIIPSGRALGYTLTFPEKDKLSVYKKQLLGKVSMLLGGRAAEMLVNDDISGGASQDMESATDIARKMVTRLGMSDRLGPVSFGSDHDEVFLGRDFGSTKNYSEQTAIAIDEEIHRIISEGLEKALQILRDKRPVLDLISSYLIKNEIMDSEQFELCFTDGVTEEMLDEHKRRKKEAAAAAKEASTENTEDNSEDKPEQSI